MNYDSVFSWMGFWNIQQFQDPFFTDASTIWGAFGVLM
jgi:hypothetical protein